MPFRSFVSGSQNACSLPKSVIALFLVYSLTIIGCQSTKDDTADINLDWEIEPDPPKVGLATLNITLRDSTDQLIPGADIELEGNMSHPGMEPVLTTAKEVEHGQYSTEMEFTMGGDWYILIESTLPDNRVVERQINIPGVRSE